MLLSLDLDLGGGGGGGGGGENDDINVDPFSASEVYYSIIVLEFQPLFIKSNNTTAKTCYQDIQNLDTKQLMILQVKIYAASLA